MKTKKFTGVTYAEEFSTIYSGYTLLIGLFGEETDNKETLHIILSRMQNRPLETIYEHLLYTEYMTENAICLLSKSGANKKIFEDLRLVVTQIIKGLKHDDISDEKIKNTVSKAVGMMLSEYRETGKIKKRDWRTDWETMLESTPKPQIQKKTFKYSPNENNNLRKEGNAIKEVNQLIKDVGNNIKSNNFLNEDNIEILNQKIKQEILALSEAHHITSEILKEQGRQ